MSELAIDPAAEFAADLDALRALHRTHALAWRLEVGALVLDRHFGGSSHEFQSQAPHKVVSFDRFVRSCAAELAEIGLGRESLRNCVKAHIAWLTLPPDVRDRLHLGHIAELARVADGTTRARLAQAALRERWNLPKLRDAVDDAQRGLWYDADPTTPGAQPPPASEVEVKVMAPGRVASRARRIADEAVAWSGRWDKVDLTRLSARRRAATADALRRGIAALEAALARVDAVADGAPSQRQGPA